MFLFDQVSLPSGMSSLQSDKNIQVQNQSPLTKNTWKNVPLRHVKCQKEDKDIPAKNLLAPQKPWWVVGPPISQLFQILGLALNQSSKQGRLQVIPVFAGSDQPSAMNSL